MIYKSRETITREKADRAVNLARRIMGNVPIGSKLTSYQLEALSFAYDALREFNPTQVPEEQREAYLSTKGVVAGLLGIRESPNIFEIRVPETPSPIAISA